jgi:hypothetical protein
MRRRAFLAGLIGCWTLSGRRVAQALDIYLPAILKGPAATATPTVTRTPTTRATSTPTATPTATPGGGTIVYVTSAGARYHRATCRYAKTASPIGCHAAEAQGYTPCLVCHPVCY